jgi:hypothetical protein
MSSDDFYLIRKHPNGGFAAVHGFASDKNKNELEATTKHLQFKTKNDALNYGLNKYPEYGVSIHPECYKKRWWRK